MKKILILVNHAITIQKFRMELIQRLVADGHEVYFSAPYSDGIEEIKKERCIYRETQIDRRGMNPIKDFKIILAYRKLIKEVKPDIIFAYTIKPNIYGAIAAKKSKTPFVANVTGLGSAVQKKGFVRMLVMGLYKYALRSAKTVFFQNKDNMHFFEEQKVAIGKHKLLPGSGVNLQRFALQDYPADDTVEFVFISRIMKEKGIDEYLLAAEKIKERYSNVRFSICGFCEERYEDTLNELQTRGIVCYHGMVEDIREVLRRVHCVVLPSYHEGMSNVLLEAAASGRPVIASDIPGCRECFEDGIGGYLIKPQDAQDVFEKMERFIKLPQETKRNMGINARERVEQLFDRQQVVQSYIKEL